MQTLPWTFVRRTLLALFGCAVVAFGSAPQPGAQPAQQPPRLESGLAITCEVFCSAAKLRTANARIRWTVSGPAMAASGITSLGVARQSLETTVFKNGFDKGLSATIPISAVAADRPVLALAQPSQSRLRAYQIRLIEVEQPRAVRAPGAGGEMSAVIENLEPGMNYTWHLVIDAAGRITSPPTMCQAPVCPADLMEASALPSRGR